MTAAPFIACGWWCASALLGAAPPPPGHAVIDASAGMAVVVPTVGAGATLGLGGRLSAGARWDSYAGLAHVFTLQARVAVAGRWAVGVDGGYGVFVSSDLFGVELEHSPFARGLTVEPVVARAAGRVGLVAGATLRLSHPAALQSVKLAVSVDLGPVFLRFQALVPLEEDTRVLGFLPTVTVGKTWGL